MINPIRNVQEIFRYVNFEESFVDRGWRFAKAWFFASWATSKKNFRRLGLTRRYRRCIVDITDWRIGIEITLHTCHVENEWRKELKNNNLRHKGVVQHNTIFCSTYSLSRMEEIWRNVRWLRVSTLPFVCSYFSQPMLRLFFLVVGTAFCHPFLPLLQDSDRFLSVVGEGMKFFWVWVTFSYDVKNFR